MNNDLVTRGTTEDIINCGLGCAGGCATGCVVTGGTLTAVGTGAAVATGAVVSGPGSAS